MKHAGESNVLTTFLETFFINKCQNCGKNILITVPTRKMQTHKRVLHIFCLSVSILAFKIIKGFVVEINQNHNC